MVITVNDSDNCLPFAFADSSLANSSAGELSCCLRLAQPVLSVGGIPRSTTTKELLNRSLEGQLEVESADVI